MVLFRTYLYHFKSHNFVVAVSFKGGCNVLAAPIEGWMSLSKGVLLLFLSPS